MSMKPNGTLSRRLERKPTQQPSAIHRFIFNASLEYITGCIDVTQSRAEHERIQYRCSNELSRVRRSLSRRPPYCVYTHTCASIRSVRQGAVARNIQTRPSGRKQHRNHRLNEQLGDSRIRVCFPRRFDERGVPQSVQHTRLLEVVVAPGGRRHAQVARVAEERGAPPAPPVPAPPARRYLPDAPLRGASLPSL